MKFVLSFVCLFACALLAQKVDALTNQELFEIVEPYLDTEDIEDYVESEGDDLDMDDDVITLPGGPDDDVDVEYLISALGLDEKATAPGPRRVPWWHHHHHHHRPPVASCHCHHDGCGCCVEKTFSVNLIFKTLKARVKGCVDVAYLPTDHGFELTFSINGHRVYHREISLKHPPKVCYKIPGMGGLARACLELYDINFGAKHICSRLVGELNLGVKTFSFHLKLGCFSIPVADAENDDDDDSEDSSLGAGEDSLSATWEESVESDDPTDNYGDGLADMFRVLQNSDDVTDDVTDDDEPLRF